MKRFTTHTFLLLAVLIVFSCKKDEEQPVNELQELKELQQAKIEDIIPAQYLDTLNTLGLVVNEGTAPPNINGVFKLSPLILSASNIKTDVIGNSFVDATIQLSGQNNSNFDINMLGKNFVSANDTSIVTVISGSGNKFSIYGKVKTSMNGKTAIFGILLSAEFVGGTMKNAKYGVINIDNSNGEGVFIKEGQARLVTETDGISEALDSF